eukprot:gene23991-2734_t
MRRFCDAEARRLRRQDAVLEAVVEDDRPLSGGPEKRPFVARLVGADRCELECHAAPLVVRTLCARRPYDATRRYATAMQAALGLSSYKAAVRIASLRASPGYARLLQGEGLANDAAMGSSRWEPGVASEIIRSGGRVRV